MTWQAQIMLFCVVALLPTQVLSSPRPQQKLTRLKSLSPQPEIKVVQKVIQAADESVTQKVTVEEDKGIEVVQEVVKPIEIKPIEKEPAPTEDEEKCYSGDQEVDCPW